MARPRCWQMIPLSGKPIWALRLPLPGACHDYKCQDYKCHARKVDRLLRFHVLALDVSRPFAFPRACAPLRSDGQAQANGPAEGVVGLGRTAAEAASPATADLPTSGAATLAGNSGRSLQSGAGFTS